MNKEDVLTWADGTWCYGHELDEMTHMSDDFQVLKESSLAWERFLDRELNSTTPIPLNTKDCVF